MRGGSAMQGDEASVISFEIAAEQRTFVDLLGDLGDERRIRSDDC